MRRLTLLLAMVATPVAAEEAASGDAIRAAISGNSVQGNMLASGGYSEFYAPDGTIKGADYSGNWSVTGNKMCFAYGGDPAQCWGVIINGAKLTWMSDGGEEGSGTIKPGNPNGF